MVIASKIISYIFHPVFVLFYIFIITIQVNPHVYITQNPKNVSILIITVFIYTVFFPIISIFILRGIGLVKSLELKDRYERIGPYIITAIFYLWLFVNIKNNANVPLIFTVITLGTIIGLFIGFVINTISKISIHSIGMGGLIAALFLIRFNFSYEYFALQLPFLGSYIINVNLLLVVGLIIGGLVGTSRLILKAHHAQDIYGGYIVGFFAQIVAMFILV